MSSAVGSSNQLLALGRNKTERGKEKHVPLQIAVVQPRERLPRLSVSP